MILETMIIVSSNCSRPARRRRPKFSTRDAALAPSVAPQTDAENCGYIVWRDLNIFVFYFHDLYGIRAALVTEPCTELKKSVHGMTNITRWIGT